MRKGLYPLPLAVEALIDDHKIGELVDDDMRRHADVLLGCRAALSQGCKTSRGGQGPHTGDVYCIVPGTLHVGNLTRSRGVQSTPELYPRNEYHFYKMNTEEFRWPQSQQTGK